MRLQGDRVTSDEVRQWRTLYAEGLSCSHIGLRFGRSASVVHRALTKLGVRMRPPGPKPRRK